MSAAEKRQERAERRDPSGPASPAPRPPIEVQLACPACRGPVELRLPGVKEQATCERCGQVITPHVTESIRTDRKLESCPVCGCEDLYVQKDFNRKLGVLIVIIGAILAPFTWYVSLFVAAGIDAALYLVLPFVTVCYDCKSVFRGGVRSPEHKPFDIHIHERYRKTT